MRSRYNYDSLVESCVISDSSGGDGGSDGGGSGGAGGEYSIMLLLLERRIPNVIIIHQSLQNDVLYHDQCPNIKMFMIKVLRLRYTVGGQKTILSSRKKKNNDIIAAPMLG